MLDYPPLDLPQRPSSRVISVATEQSLCEAHHLLATAYGPGDAPRSFGLAACTMTVLAFAAASAMRAYDPLRGRNAEPDAVSFRGFATAFMPWDHVSVEDDQHRSGVVLQAAAADALYLSIRNPLVHDGGLVVVRPGAAPLRPALQIRHRFPGRARPEELSELVDLCARPTLDGQPLMSLRHDRVEVHTRELYWCARRAIEAFARDPAVQADIDSRWGVSGP